MAGGLNELFASVSDQENGERSWTRQPDARELEPLSRARSGGRNPPLSGRGEVGNKDQKP
jgi:hypothetical protein